MNTLLKAYHLSTKANSFDFNLEKNSKLSTDKPTEMIYFVYSMKPWVVIDK